MERHLVLQRQRAQLQSSFNERERRLVVFAELSGGMAELPHGVFLFQARGGVQDFVEAVNVQLAHETGHVPVFEISAKRFGELLVWTYQERICRGGFGPADEVRDLFVVEHIIELMHKRAFF